MKRLTPMQRLVLQFMLVRERDGDIETCALAVSAHLWGEARAHDQVEYAVGVCELLKEAGLLESDGDTTFTLTDAGREHARAL